MVQLIFCWKRNIQQPVCEMESRKRGTSPDGQMKVRDKLVFRLFSALLVQCFDMLVSTSYAGNKTNYTEFLSFSKYSP